MPKAHAGFRNCLVIVNPQGSNSHRGRQLQRSLARTFANGSVETFRLSKQELERPTKLRRALGKLDKTWLVAIIGGDGTVNFVVSELLASPKVAARRVTILPLWGGNACDLAHMANGRPRSSVRRIVRRGKPVAVRPLEYTISGANMMQNGFAMCYVSFGAVALTAEVLDKSKLVRLTGRIAPLRLLSEMAVGIAGLHKSKRFSITHNNQTRKVYDILLINGPRMAKLYRTPAKLGAAGFVELIVRHKYPVLFTHLTRLTHVWAHGKTVRSHRLELHEPTWMQQDGEVSQLPADTTVSVTPAKQAVQVLVTQ